MTKTKTKTDNRWGIGVFALYGSFVLFILACVGFASFQRFDLVEEGYYDKGIKYQEQIDRISRTQNLVERPSIDVNTEGRTLVVTFPLQFPADRVSGTLLLFRPSNAHWDRKVTLQLNEEQVQKIPLAGLPAGQWVVKLEWSFDAVQYYTEETLFLR